MIASLPVLAVSAVAIRLTSPGPVVFRQRRVGRGGKVFTLYKLRTMASEGAGTQVTARGDARITPVGRVLRATKLDELPQLWNVANGSMALVGPRPEVERYVDSADPLRRAVLGATPGITSPVTLQLRDEEALLAQVPASDRERFYAEKLVPFKLRGDLEYLRRRNAWSDVGVLVKTLTAVLRRDGVSTPSPRDIADGSGREP